MLETPVASYKRVAEGEVFIGDNGYLVVVGDPPPDGHLPEERRHNCDAMGCRHDHVVYRVKISEGHIPQTEAPPLGRFGHHPDRVIDFCVEVEGLEGLVEDVRAGIQDRKPVEGRIFKAMQFRVGGVERAVMAKGTLRKVEVRLKGLS